MIQKLSKNQTLKSLILLAGLGLMLAGCQPEELDFQRNSPVLLAQGATDTIHIDPEVICGVPIAGKLVDAQGQTGSGNFSGADAYGTWQLLSTPTQMNLQVSMNRGWFISQASLYMGSEEGLPKNAAGSIDYESLPYQDVISPIRNIYDAIWPKSAAMECPNTVWTVARFKIQEMDFLGNPANETYIWCQGTSMDNAGAQAINYCAPSCDAPEPPTPPVPPACTIPTLAPGDDLSEYFCQNGNGPSKVTVCHIPPGNPANMQEICISVNALDAHIIDFKPANNPCLGHHSGCHIGPCDPCGPGSTGTYAQSVTSNCPGN